MTTTQAATGTDVRNFAETGRAAASSRGAGATHAESSGSSLVVLLQTAARDRAGRARLALGAAALALLGLIFFGNLRQFLHVWSNDDNYSHGFLVPLISLYFANQAAARGPLKIEGGVAIGVVLLVVSVLGRLATIVVPVGFAGDLSFVLGLTGLCALAFGRRALRRFAFALFFLVFMIPLPVALYAAVATPLQLWVSQVASSILNAVGVPVLCEGNMMTLPGNIRMFVAEACSGMRQLTGFLALTAAVAYLSQRPPWYRAVVVLSAAPIALTANLARVVVTGVIMYGLDPSYAEGTFHTLEGLLLMALGLGMLRAECAVLDLVAAPAAAIEPATRTRPAPI